MGVECWRLGISVWQRCPATDWRVVLGALASIEHAVVPDHTHDAMATTVGAGAEWRLESLCRGSVAPRRQQRELSLVVDAGENVVTEQVGLVPIGQQPIRRRRGGHAYLVLDLRQSHERRRANLRLIQPRSTIGTPAGGIVSSTTSPTRKW